MVCVFFFKQKTAYEMRISDWSSDVFSSDLRYGCLGYRRRASYPHPRLAHTGGQQLTRDRQTVRYRCLDRDCGHEFSAGPGPVESGRASCRERGCQEGYNSVVAHSLKKTTNRVVLRNILPARTIKRRR